MLRLPRGHSESELAMAQRLARELGSEELLVFWSDGPPARRGRAPARPALAHGLAAVGAVIGALASAVSSRRPGTERTN